MRRRARWRVLWRQTLEWCEEHAGLGGWVGAIGAVIAIFVTWGLARSEYLRTLRLEDARVNAEINLILITAADFDPMVQKYITYYRDNDPSAKGYYNRQLNDARMIRMVDFNTMPITQWPSVASYDAFKRYFFASITLMETSVDVDKSSDVDQRIKAHEGTLLNLKKALESARR
jgi:hypothetical protein